MQVGAILTRAQFEPCNAGTDRDRLSQLTQSRWLSFLFWLLWTGDFRRVTFNYRDFTGDADMREAIGAMEGTSA